MAEPQIARVPARPTMIDRTDSLLLFFDICPVLS
jgi:hypothetical protein